MIPQFVPSRCVILLLRVASFSQASSLCRASGSGEFAERVALHLSIFFLAEPVLVVLHLEKSLP